MTEATVIGEPLVKVFGALTGFTALTIAIYFQMIAKRRAPHKYIVTFAAVGIILIVVNSEAVGVNRNMSMYFEFFLYLSIFVMELAGAYKIYVEMQKSGIISFPTNMLYYRD